MKQLDFPCILLLLLPFLAVSSCSDDEKEDFNGEGVPFVFSQEETNLPAEGGTMDFVFQNNNVKTCGYIYKINDYTFDSAFVYFARDDSYYEGFDWENFLKDYPFYPYNWDGCTKHDYGWVTVGVSADRKHLTVELEPNDSTVARTVGIVTDYNGRGHVQVRQAGKAAAGE